MRAIRRRVGPQKPLWQLPAELTTYAEPVQVGATVSEAVAMPSFSATATAKPPFGASALAMLLLRA